ncbi:MAG TPA: hypothetical protein DCX02_02740, partial [Firmicutes bacterium]|nr:hypothetical protein [Bacillota bacterium]
MDNLHQHAATDIDTRELRELQARCIEALQRYGLPEGIINHSRKVARVAEIIARELEASGYPVDLRSVVAG